MTPLTPTERKVYDFIVKYRKEIGYVPTSIAISNEFEWSDSGQHARNIIGILKKKKWLDEMPRCGLYKLKQPVDN